MSIPTEDNKKEPKVVLVGPSAEKYKGGIAQFTSYLADCLRPLCAVKFISWYEHYPYFLSKREFRDMKSKTTVAESQAEFMLGYMNPLSWYRSAREMARFSPEIICFTWIHPVHAPVLAFLCLYLRWKTSAEITYICHSVLPHERFPGARFLTRIAFWGAHRFIVHGQSEADDVLSLVREKKITRLFLPLFCFFVPAEQAGEAEEKTPGKELLFFGIIRPYKGLDILLRALPLVLNRYPDVRVRVVGEYFTGKSDDKMGAHASDPLTLIEELNLKDVVTTEIGYVPNERVEEVFTRADAAVYPYRSATQSGSLAVAYSYGVPVIITPVGGLPDMVEDGVSGYVAKDATPEDFADAIIRFMEQPITSENVFGYASRFSWDNYLAGLFGDRCQPHMRNPCNHS